MKKVKSIILTALAIILAFLAMVFITNAMNAPEKDENTNYSNISDRTEAYMVKKAKLSEIKREDGVVNIYLFWGDGCPHCKDEWAWLESIREEYKDVNIYGFETWYSEANSKIMQQFATALGEEARGVPYTVIGNKSISGFADGKEHIEAIKNARKSGFDLYFDKIK